MLRRQFFCSIALCGSGLITTIHPAVAGPRHRRATLADFDAALANAVDTGVFDSSRRFRELEFRDTALTETQASMMGRRSKRRIHQRAIDLIVSAEISSRIAYERRYKHPEWPGGRSGVTIGIGYDLGFVKPKAFADHWEGLLTPDQISELSKVCKLTGEKAASGIASLKRVQIDWAPAEKQFQRFLPYVIAETEDTFPNTAELSDMCLGALVSLVYNRGSNTNPDNKRRRHMHYCREAMKNRQYNAIPKYIRDMKVLWQNEKNARGLLIRRDLEADLFEAGLS